MKYEIYVLRYPEIDDSNYYSVVIIPERCDVYIVRYFKEFHVVRIINKESFKRCLEEKYILAFGIPEDVPRYVLDHIESEFFEIDLMKKYRGKDHLIEVL